MKEEWKEILPALYGRTSIAVLKEFIHRCADDISCRKPPQYEQFLSTGWTKEEFHSAMLNSKLFLLEAVKGNYNLQLIEATFPDLDKQLTAALSHCINVRSNELKESLLGLASGTPGTSLVDFDWKLKWILGSSSLSTLQEPLLSVNLHTVTKMSDCQGSNCNSNNEKPSTVDLELNCAELDAFISSLENVEDSPQR